MSRPSRSSSSGSRFLSDSPVYLIADLHLDGDRPAATRLLLDFLSGPVREARALYILGDLFEAWIGDDAPPLPAPEIAAALSVVAANGVEIYFVVGNRDFLLGEHYCSRASMTLLEEPVHIQHGDHALILMHGDVLCTDDHAYQKFRRKVRDPEWQDRMLARPVWARRLIARLARTISKRRNRNTPENIMDVNQESVALFLNEEGVSTLIHGHTHRPAIHRIKLGQQQGLRAVLGDWHADRGSAIRLQSDSMALLKLVRNRSNEIELLTEDVQALG